MSPLTRFRRRERHGLHVAGPLPAPAAEVAQDTAETTLLRAPACEAETAFIPSVRYDGGTGTQQVPITGEALAGAARIVAQVEAEKRAEQEAARARAAQASAPTVIWDRPDDFPPSADARPYVPAAPLPWGPWDMPATPRMTAAWEPVSAEESAARVARITFPGYDGTRERWAAVMCQVSAATGTRSRYEEPAMWGAARPGRSDELAITWGWQREPLLALPAGATS